MRVVLLLGGVVLGLISVQAQEKPRPSRKVALLVGPKTYLHDFTALPHLDDDVTALAKELRTAGFEEVVVLTDLPEGKAPATRKNLLAVLGRLLSGGGDATKALRKGDVLLLALSGHGTEIFVDGKTKDTFFAPVDGKKGDPTTLVRMADVLAQAGGSGCQALVLADMCRDIYDPNKGKGVDTDSLTLPRNSAVLFGCESSQQSFVNTDLKHSVFTYAVLQVLREANTAGKPLLWSELVAGVENQFASDQFKKLMGQDRQQTPVERKKDLRATLVVIGKPGAQPPRAELPDQPRKPLPQPPLAPGRVRVTAAQTGAYTSASDGTRDPVLGILEQGDEGVELERDNTEKMVRIEVSKDGKTRRVWVSLSSVEVLKK